MNWGDPIVPTSITELTPQGPRVFHGSYDAYVQAMGREAPGLRSAN